jgi:PAS domain S-box-containing protein
MLSSNDSRLIDAESDESADNTTGVAFLAVTADGIITEWNSHAEMTFGWSAAEAIGRAVGDVVCPARASEPDGSVLERFLASQDVGLVNRRIETTAVHRNGREVPVELTISDIC